MAIDSEKLYSTPPPPFGHALLKYFPLDLEFINLNSGSFGSAPLPVLQSAATLSSRIERSPDRFLRLEFQPILASARERLAEMIGAKAHECVLVANASTAVNTVLRNMVWEAGDILVVFSTTFVSIGRTAQNIADTSPNPMLSTFILKFPISSSEMLSNFRKHLRSLPRSPNNRVVAIINSINSHPGLLLPWQELVKVCREENVISLVDAAHSLGQELGINLTQAGPDFWLSNCHKWMYAKRSCAVLYVPERNQHMIKTSIPTSFAYISPKDRSGPNFIEQFEWNGTIDLTSYLTICDALDFRLWLGGEETINAYCHDLALRGGERLAEILGTEILRPEGGIRLSMVNVRLPFPRVPFSSEISNKFKEKFLVERNMFSTHFVHDGQWWTRCSAQVWNEIGDFEKLGQAWLEVCKEVVEELGLGLGVEGESK